MTRTGEFVTTGKLIQSKTTAKANFGITFEQLESKIITIFAYDMFMNNWSKSVQTSTFKVAIGLQALSSLGQCSQASAQTGNTYQNNSLQDNILKN